MDESTTDGVRENKTIFTLSSIQDSEESHRQWETLKQVEKRTTGDGRRISFGLVIVVPDFNIEDLVILRSEENIKKRCQNRCIEVGVLKRSSNSTEDVGSVV